MVEDRDVLHHITELVEEERALRSSATAGHALDEDAVARIAHLEVQLDQCWDLLRRRQAKEEFGQDPNTESTRDETVVEHYLQ